MELFLQAASLLKDGTCHPEAAESAAELLASLGYWPSAETPAQRGETTAHQVRMLRAAASIDRFIHLRIQSAPGLIFVGGEVGVGTGSVSGSGLTMRAAMESCIGEAVEYLSQFAVQGDVRGADGTALVVDACAGWSPEWLARPEDGYVRATRLNDGADALLPASRCLRLQPAPLEPPPFALSTGCGAGRTIAEATAHGLLELIERDAVALWWRGGMEGRAIAADGAAAHAAGEFLAAARGPEPTGRSVWLLDITTDLGVPTVAALSSNADGRLLACGSAARPNLASAAVAAARDMLHIELAYDVVEAKRRERGEAALNDADRRHVERATQIAVADCPILRPALPPRAALDVTPRPTPEPSETLAALIKRLDDADVEAFSVDLTRPAFGIPVVRVVAPQLQLEPCVPTTPRLRAAAKQSIPGSSHISIL